ncbi:hypothetical protein K7432_005928 [Basidiobolus ranarum]|uniref:JmjC domain-containing protein n=1 Tax=Basidiobolus ranarum TaxID=34480 RepID=A0ABR2WVV5_9FUNG
MADAVNLMIYSIDAVNPEESRPIKGEGSLAEDHRDAGAVWDIYHFQDLPKIRVFLREYADEIGHSVDDPIHDQVFYLNETLRQRLFAKYGVRGWRVYQNPGDAVFVPAGCAHQVCNYKSCIKVAMDFVSPENVSRCAELTKEFRLLSQGHRRRQDLLQLESILYHSWLNSESAINGEKVDELLPEENEDLVDLKTPPRKIKTKVTSKVSSKMEDSPRSSRSSRRKLPENTKKPVEEIPNDFRDEEATLDDEIVDLLSSPQSKTRKRPSNSARPRGSVTIPNSRNSKLIRKKIYRDDSSSDSSLTDLSDLIESSDDSSASQNKKPISSIKATKSSKSHKRFADNSDLDFSSDEEDVKPKKSRKSITHSPSSKLSSNHRRTENANKYSAGVEKPPVITRLKSDIGIALNATSKKLKKQTKSSPLKPAPKIKLILNTRDQESEDLPASNALSSTEALGTSKENPPDIMYNQSTTDPAKDSDSEFAIALLGLSGSKNSHIFSPPSAESKRD